MDAAWKQMRQTGFSMSELLQAAKEDGADVRSDSREFDESDLLPCGCCLCEGPLSERDAVHTGKGMAHEECAEKRWPFDPYRDLGIPRGEL
jgi:hypothetical protein